MQMFLQRGLSCLLLIALVMFRPMHASAQQQTAIINNLPSAAEWKQHLERDILPFWQTAAALGNPVGSFPTFRCNDGSIYDAQVPCPEFTAAPEWIRSAVGRQYVRMISRQIYLYGVAFHLTGDQKYLVWARAGVRYILDHAFDNANGGVVSYWEAGKAVSEFPDRTSQDVAYSLVGLSFYYYLTRDPSVLQPMLRIEHYIRQNYYDPRLGVYRWERQGPDADRLELVAQLDQANAYMLLLTPLLPPSDQKQWRTELSQIAQTIRNRFFDRSSGMFLGTLAQKPGPQTCIFDREDTDFGHTIKTYWMLYFIGRLTHDKGLENFTREHAPGLFKRAYLPDTASWATQPTCSQELNRTSTWWMAAELDQAALTFGISNPEVLRYIPATYDFWLKHMVDHPHGEVWDELTLPNYIPQRPKVHLWKNGFHTAEHAMIGYIATNAIRSEPVVLYYAFENCKMPEGVRPYYYDGVVKSHAEAPLQDMPGFCRVEVTFSNVH